MDNIISLKYIYKLYTIFVKSSGISIFSWNSDLKFIVANHGPELITLINCLVEQDTSL